MGGGVGEELVASVRDELLGDHPVGEHRGFPLLS
jgi:hypothetical protein